MRHDHSGERRQLACSVWQLAKHNFVGRLPTIAGWQPALPRQDCFGETRALPGITAIRLLDFSGQEPAEIGQAVEIAENFDVEILVVVY